MSRAESFFAGGGGGGLGRSVGNGATLHPALGRWALGSKHFLWEPPAASSGETGKPKKVSRPPFLLFFLLSLASFSQSTLRYVVCFVCGEFNDAAFFSTYKEHKLLNVLATITTDHFFLLNGFIMQYLFPGEGARLGSCFIHLKKKSRLKRAGDSFRPWLPG
jgi:hypothetical protein